MSTPAAGTTKPGVVLHPRDFRPKISLVVPVFNEESALEPFLERTSKVLKAAALDFEYVFVNDGSTDSTLEKLLGICSCNEHIRVVNLSRNFGKEAAVTAGIDHIEGDVMVPIDADLQDPPELIPEFVMKWREGYDMVYGLRVARPDDSAVKRATAEGFYRIFNRLSAQKIPENAGDFRLLDRRVVEVLRLLPERTRFMKGLYAWVGFSSVAVAFDRPDRAAGESKWNYRKLWNFALDGIFSFSTIPLRIWSYLGLTISLVAFLYAIFIVTRVLILGIDLPGYPSLVTIILFLGGIQLISLGIIGEYIGRMFIESKRRPLYLVEGVYENGRPVESR